MFCLLPVDINTEPPRYLNVASDSENIQVTPTFLHFTSCTSHLANIEILARLIPNQPTQTDKDAAAKCEARMPVIKDDHREHALNVVFWDLNDEETQATQYFDRPSQLRRLAVLIEREDLKLTTKSSPIQEPETRTPTAHELRELLRLLLPSSNGYVGVKVFAKSPLDTLLTPQREKYLKKPASKGVTSSNARMPKDIGGILSEPINTSNKDSEMQIEARSAPPARSSKAEGQSKRRLLEVDDSSEDDAPVSNKRRKGAATKGKSCLGTRLL